METPQEILNRLTTQIDSEIGSLGARLQTGGKLIDAEFDENKKQTLMKSWGELDKVYKRLNLIRSILISGDKEPLQGVYCAVCLGLVKPDDLLHSGWSVKEE